MMAVLVEKDADRVSLGAGEVDRLAELGVAHISLLADGSTLAILLEGWAFEPARSASAALSVLLGSDDSGARVLHQAARVALSQGREA